ncbi:MAG TPA: cysteine--tRNA ligase [Dehalococcoidia bacterium]|nr:cysteine--tRNA ligase [Dehalococcoidia bacterium]
MKIFNTLTRRVEQVEPIEPGRIRLYSCGPTVYRFIHIGNLRTFCLADWLRRAFEYQGVAVLHIKNITDVGHMRVERLDQGEDKLIAQARAEGKSSWEIAEFYTQAFHEDEAKLNILPAQHYPRATDHIPEMIEIIQGLERKGLAYAVGGNVYYDLSRFDGYGKLSGNDIEGLLAGVRDGADAEKRNPEDFPLWKQAEPGREMAWDSPWGRGFPGWHIECSAMSMKYLGPRFDLHTGGVDNIFPHHEGEIAQSEGYTGRPFVNYWVHAQHLLADGLKMAKSTGNAYTLADIEARGFDRMALRFLFATVHYRSRLNFTFASLKAAERGLNRLRGALLGLADQVDFDRLIDHLPETDPALREAFLTALNDDLNLPRALAVVWGIARRAPARLAPADRLAAVLDFDRVLGLRLQEWLVDARQADRIGWQECLAALPEPVGQIVREREAARGARDYSRADALRARLRAAGYEVRDTRRGPIVVPADPEEGLDVISTSASGPSFVADPDACEFSVSLIAHNSREDLDRCLASLAAHRRDRSIEAVIVDNGSTDDTLPYLRALARRGVYRAPDGATLPVRVLFGDHNLGFAAGRNATFRACRGRYIVALDTSIELIGDIWTPLAEALADPEVGLAGPYGLVTADLREFRVAPGPDVDAIEGYLMAFPRRLLEEIGWADEKFRFYRLLDIHQSFFFKTAGYRVVTVPEVGDRVRKHPHREWFSLTPEEQATKSKKNYDLFRARWHHGESLLTANFDPAHRWQGHSHESHLGAGQSHPDGSLPPPGERHVHVHQHWADHSHSHAHVHDLPEPATRKDR